MSVILTDCDGVLLNWEYAFNIWMTRKGYKRVEGHEFIYSIGDRYGISKEEGKNNIRLFNESAMIGFLPPHRDAIEYVQRLHREHGYVFHVITSLSTEQAACELRTMNLQKLFGETVFEKFIYLDTGADKDEILTQYRDTEYWWVEDKVMNATEGLKNGLKPIIMEHGHNMNRICDDTYYRVKNWKEIYYLVTGT